MGKGLGKNSPLVLSLGKENYEALIERHGQWVRWRTTNKCSCVNVQTQQPDIRCKKCAGLGIVYTYQKEKTVTAIVLCRDGSGIISLDEEYQNNALVKVYDINGKTYADAIKKGIYVDIGTTTQKGNYVTCVMTESIIHKVNEVECEELSNGYYRVKGITSSRTNIDELYHTVPGDIVRIGAVIDANGEVYQPGEFRQDMFYIEPKKEIDEETGEEATIPIENPVTAKEVEYVPPFTFVILNQNLNKTDEMIMQEANGDAVLTFPYNCNVTNDDVITVLSGTYTNKTVMNRKRNSEYDVIPAYFVAEILSCVMDDREFIEGIDFILCGTNRIKWICEDAPEEGEVYSVTYNVYPTYKVVKNIPQIRTSENQRMPKKAIVKMYDTYGEARGINKQ